MSHPGPWLAHLGRRVFVFRVRTMTEQPVNLPTAIYLGVFSRAEQRVLQAIFKAIAEGRGKCVATLAMLARDSNTSKSTTRNAIAQAVAIGLLEKTERRSYCAVSLPNILTYGKPNKRAAHMDSKVSTVRNHQRFRPRPTTRPFSAPQMHLTEAVTDHSRSISTVQCEF
jgi:hypothetical protein